MFSTEHLLCNSPPPSTCFVMQNLSKNLEINWRKSDLWWTINGCCFSCKLGRTDISWGRGNSVQMVVRMRWVRVFGVVERSEDTNVELFRPLLPLPLPCYSESGVVKKRNYYMENFWRWFQLFCWCFRLCLKHCSSSCCCCRSWKLTSTRMDVRQQTMHQRPVREKSTCRYSQNRHSFSFLSFSKSWWTADFRKPPPSHSFVSVFWYFPGFGNL